MVKNSKFLKVCNNSKKVKNNQQIDDLIWQEFQKEQEKELHKIKNKISNSGKPPSNSWIEKIVQKISISELASEHGIQTCPFGHALYFNDNRGWFCCSYQRWNHVKCFAGNLVDFVKFCEVER